MREEKKKRNLIIKILVIIVFLSIIGNLTLQLAAPWMANKMMNDLNVKKEITITTDGTSGVFPVVDEDNIADSRYRDSIEEAVRLDSVVKEIGDVYICKVDEIIFEMESDEYKIVFYRSIKNDKFQRLTFAKFKKKEIDGQMKYAYLYSTIFDRKKGAKVWGDFKSSTESSLQFSDFDRDRGVEPGVKRFLWGVTTYDDVYRMKIEGQEPTEIIAYDVFGKDNYFWYYEDIQSDKLFREMELTVDE